MWKEIVKKYYGARFCHKWHQIYADVTSVLLGLKPSLLLDYLPTDTLRFQLFMQEVLTLHLGHEPPASLPKLRILKLDEDVLLTNSDFLIPEWRPEFVDITKGIPLPLLVSEEDCSVVNKQLAVWYKDLLQKITEPSEVLAIVSSSDLSDNVNRCTLFGWLLNYPVVYWFDPEIGYSLSMVELVCYTVTVHPAPAETSDRVAQRPCMLEKVG